MARNKGQKGSTRNAKIIGRNSKFETLKENEFQLQMLPSDKFLCGNDDGTKKCHFSQVHVMQQQNIHFGR